MTDIQRPQTTLTVGDKTLTLVESMNGYCAMEELVDQSTGKVVMAAAEGSMLATRALLWCYLQEHHATEYDTLDKVGALVDAVGSEAVIQQIAQMGAANGNGQATPGTTRRRQVKARG